MLNHIKKANIFLENKGKNKRKRHASLRGVAWLSDLTSWEARMLTDNFMFKVYLAGGLNRPLQDCS